MIAVLGATGRVGRQVVEQLLAAGQRVRAIARSRRKLAELEARGASVFCGDANDSAFLAAAFTDVDGVFIVMPHDVRSNDYHAEQDRLGEAIAYALRSAAVRRIVFLSSIGAEQPVDTGVLGSLHRQEQRLHQLGTNVLMLRPGSFYENFFESLPVIKEQGVLADAYTPDALVPMIATRDVATIAARAVLARDWTGVSVREITGPRDLTYPSIARIIGAAIDKRGLEYVQLPYDAMAEAFLQAGFSSDVARQYVGLSRAINEGRVAALGAHGKRHVGTTSFETFASELATAYRARLRESNVARIANKR